MAPTSKLELPKATDADGARLADLAHSALREAIQAGKIHAGERLNEVELAKTLGVSRTPVREALLRLEVAGIVESVPRRGFIVVDVREDAATVYSVRQRLEGLAAALAARQITVAELERLSSLQERMDALAAEASSEALSELAIVNTEFHTLISAAAGSSRLHRLIEQVSTAYISRQVVKFYRSEELLRSMEGHRLILDALWKRDSERADELVQDHLTLGREIVLRQIMENAEGTDRNSG